MNQKRKRRSVDIAGKTSLSVSQWRINHHANCHALITYLSGRSNEEEKRKALRKEIYNSRKESMVKPSNNTLFDISLVNKRFCDRSFFFGIFWNLIFWRIFVYAFPLADVSIFERKKLILGLNSVKGRHDEKTRILIKEVDTLRWM